MFLIHISISSLLMVQSKWIWTFLWEMSRKQLFNFEYSLSLQACQIKNPFKSLWNSLKKFRHQLSFLQLSLVKPLWFTRVINMYFDIFVKLTLNRSRNNYNEKNIQWLCMYNTFYKNFYVLKKKGTLYLSDCLQKKIDYTIKDRENGLARNAFYGTKSSTFFAHF